jgi:hypothetical protein
MTVVQDAGDMLFFPPNWGHSVITKKGPNVMLNLRETAFGIGFMQMPWRILEAVAARFVSEISQWQYTHAKTTKMQDMLIEYRLDIIGTNGIDSPCTDMWKNMLNDESL